MLNPEQKAAAANLLDNVRNTLINNSAARSVAGGVGGYLGGQIAGAVANTILPNQFDVDPNLLAGLGAGYGAFHPQANAMLERAMARRAGGDGFAGQTVTVVPG